MTIREFANLVGCNPQTLRYYDHIDLLKPVKVDSWSGYRYYDKEQALLFIKIRNMQKAGFSIEEIRELLDKQDSDIYQAFEEKIQEQKDRLQQMIKIQKSYRTELNEMKAQLEKIRTQIQKDMHRYDPAEEFGIDRETYQKIIENIDTWLEGMIDGEYPDDVDFSTYPDSNREQEEKDFYAALNDPNYTLVYEKHDWKYVKDFFEEFCTLESGQVYMLLFEVEEEKAENIAFANVILHLLLMKNEEKEREIYCQMIESKDGRNHFWLMKKN